MPILRILRIKIKMEVPFLYKKFLTNQYKNKISPKCMYKNRTFCSQLVFIFLKILLLGRQCRLQCRQQLKTLYTPGRLEIMWELFPKKSAEILSFRHFFHSLVPHKSQVSIRLLRIPEPASILQIVPANSTGLVEMYLMTMGRSKLFLTVDAYNLQILRPFWKRLELLFSSSALIASSQI